jgi:hypothetical protein
VAARQQPSEPGVAGHGPAFVPSGCSPPVIRWMSNRAALGDVDRWPHPCKLVKGTSLGATECILSGGHVG